MLFGNSKSGDNYKFNSLSTYAWGRAVGGKRKYRRVFEKSELTYLSVELSFYNKLFDEDDWGTEIRLLANKIDGDNPEKICEKTETVKVRKQDNIHKYSFGWGNDKRGDFWDRGIYEWEAYIDGELVSTTKFYIEDMGLVHLTNNPYLSVTSFNTYEAPSGDVDADERVFLKSFNIDTTRYIMGELKGIAKSSLIFMMIPAFS